MGRLPRGVLSPKSCSGYYFDEPGWGCAVRRARCPPSSSPLRAVNAPGHHVFNRLILGKADNLMRYEVPLVEFHLPYDSKLSYLTLKLKPGRK